MSQSLQLATAVAAAGNFRLVHSIPVDTTPAKIPAAVPPSSHITTSRCGQMWHNGSYVRQQMRDQSTIISPSRTHIHIFNKQ